MSLYVDPIVCIEAVPTMSNAEMFENDQSLMSTVPSNVWIESAISSNLMGNGHIEREAIVSNGHSLTSHHPPNDNTIIGRVISADTRANFFIYSSNQIHILLIIFIISRTARTIPSFWPLLG